MAKDAKKTQNKKVNKNTIKEDDKKVVKKASEKVKKEDTKKSVKKDTKKAEKKDNKKVEKVEVVEVREIKKDDSVKAIKAKKRKERTVSTLKKVDDNRKAIILFVVGFLVATLLFRCILWPDRIATLKDGTQPVAKLTDETITADDLYTSMKSYYSVNVLLNDIDDIILSEMYPENDEMNEEVANTADYYYSSYEQYYGYTKEEFLSEYGFATEADFLDNLRLDHRRNLYFEEYVEGLVTDKEIEKYYEEDVFGDVDSKHILVAIDEENGLTDEDAKKLAQEIIGKLNNGTSWDDVVTEYNEQITHEELGYNAFNASLESAYLQECKKLEVGSYSKSPVLTSYGYHIVYKIDQKDKPKLDDVKDDVIEALATQKKDKDTNLYYKSLINMRDEAGLEFIDTKLGDEYTKYRNSYK